MFLISLRLFLFFFNDTATTEIYTLSLHDALPILCHRRRWSGNAVLHQLSDTRKMGDGLLLAGNRAVRSEEHTSELQSHSDLVCRLLLEKKKKKNNRIKY